MAPPPECRSEVTKKSPACPALAGATRFSIEQPEPGNYYVVEVLEAD
jgi:hypothetical protein